jgi:hypothetical protein
MTPPILIHAPRPAPHTVLRSIPHRINSYCHAVLHYPRVLHIYLHVLGIFLCHLFRSIVGPQSYGCLSLLLGIWLILQCLDSASLSALVNTHNQMSLATFSCVCFLCCVWLNFAHFQTILHTQCNKTVQDLGDPPRLWCSYVVRDV